MFTYLNPAVRQKLLDQGSLIRINRQGETMHGHALPGQDPLIINLLGPTPLPLQMRETCAQAEWYAAVRSTELSQVEELAHHLRENQGENLFARLASPMAVNSVLIFGNALQNDNPLVRIHSNCLTGDVFGSQRCECGPQLASAVERISADQAGGMIVYMSGHEGRGIGLWAKAATYLLQDGGEDTYQANESLGLPTDCRDFTDAAALIHHFIGNRVFRLLTNNPNKIEYLSQAGLTEFTTEKHISGVSEWNKRYLFAKQAWGHKIDVTDIDEP